MFVKKIMFLVLFILLGVMSTKVNAMQPGDKGIIKSAEQGSATAQQNLSASYAKGQGVEQDYEKTLRWYRDAAAQGDANAQFVLGWCYYLGLRVKQDYEEAVRWFRLAVEQGNAEAQCYLGMCYAKGQGVKQNYEEAVRWFRLAAEQGDILAQCGLGVCYDQGQGVKQDCEEAVRWFRLAAGQGNPDAQYNLGVCYTNGRGVKQDYEEAIKWYRLASEQGNAIAQYSLGVCYAKGHGVKQDYEESVRWYRLAAEKGEAIAQFVLGTYYANGRVVDQSYEEAVRWYRLAAEQGDAEAQYNLGVFYANGQGVDQSYEEAARWYRLAAEHGNAEAQYYLGVCYEDGTGVKQDSKEAVRWFRLAAEQDDADAQYVLGVFYAHGIGVKQDREEALKWYRLAANQGNAKAQHVLALCYYRGNGVSRDLAEAAKWFNLYRLATNKGKNSVQALVDPVERIYNLFSELEKIETREQGLEFVIMYFSEHFGRIRKFLEENGIANYKDKALIQDKIDSKAIDMSVLNKLLTEAYDALECAKFVLTHVDSDTNPEALERVLRFISEKDFCITLSRSDIILTDAFLTSYVVSPWRTIKVPDDEMSDVGILANIFGAGFSRDLMYCGRVTAGENIYDYIFGNKDRIFKNRFLYLCENDEGRVRSLLARVMHWLRCMKEKYDTGGLTEDKKRIYEKCINLVETQFLSVTGACSNELADVMIMWAADIDACEDAMGIGARICDQKVFDERFTTAYRQYLYERVLSNDYVLSIKKESDLVKRLSSALCSGCGPEFRNFYRFLVARLLNVIPMLGDTFIADREIIGQDMVTLVSEAVNLKDMCTVALDMYHGLADEKDAQADERTDLSSETEEKPIKEKLAIDIENIYKLFFKEFCSVVDKTCAGDFEKRLRDFLSCEFDDMDESTRQAIEEMESWISEERAFTIGELVNMTLNIDLTYSHTENIPELTRFGSVIGGRGEKSAEYYAKVLYPIHLLKAEFIEIK